MSSSSSRLPDALLVRPDGEPRMASAPHLSPPASSRTGGRAWAVATLGALVLATAACGVGAAAGSSSDQLDTATSGVSADADADGVRCVVHLHGKSGGGGEPYVNDDITYVFPDGNAEGWGGRQWLYFPDEDYETARQVVADATAGCGAILLGGFSNGAAFAAKLFCRGETFDGRLLGVVVDDPVTDEGVVDCSPVPGIRLTLYWTGALAETAQPGWDCSLGDWTCEGGITIGIEAYAEWLDTDVTDSPFTEHQPYIDAPELDDWTPVADPSDVSETSPSATPEPTA